MNKRKFGIIGEKITQGYLIKKGYKIIKTNFYTKKGEIDIIAQENQCIIFIEVKTRTNLKYGTPAIAVNNTKKKHIKNAAKIFLYLNKCEMNEIRFDIIEVFFNEGKCKINHLKAIM